MKLQIIPVINTISCPSFAPTPSVTKHNFGHGLHMILYLYSHLQNVKLTTQVHANSYKLTKVFTVIACAWNVINMCNFYVTDNEIYCNTRIHDILKIHD